MIKYKKTLGEESTAIEFETMGQLIEYVRLENGTKELPVVTTKDDDKKRWFQYVFCWVQNKIKRSKINHNSK